MNYVIIHLSLAVLFPLLLQMTVHSSSILGVAGHRLMLGGSIPIAHRVLGPP